MIKCHDQNQRGEERVYLVLWVVVYHPGKSGQELEAETEEEAMRNTVYWFANCCLLILLAYKPRDYLHQDSATHGRQGLSYQLLIQTVAPQTCLLANPMETFSQLRVLFPDMTRFVSSW